MPGRRIYCNHCYNEGHNKRTCPVLTRQMEDRYHDHDIAAIQHRQRGHGVVGGYNEQQAEKYRALVIGRTGIDPKTKKKVTKKAAKAARMKDRTCTYCQNMGHTRRTCDILKEDMNVMKEATRLNRLEVARRLAASRINVGALVVVNFSCYIGNDWTRVRLPCMVRGFNWDRCGWGVEAHATGFIELRGLTSRLEDSDKDRRITLDSFENALVDGEATPCSSGVKPPSSWLGVDPVKGHSLKSCFPSANARTRQFYRTAFIDEDSPFYAARISLGLSMDRP